MVVKPNNNTTCGLKLPNVVSMLFSVCTPTFNRAHTLRRVYDSLLAQTCKDFEWIVIDDGSSDKTRALVSEWQKEAWFPITYQYQANCGKHVSVNQAVAIAKGELFLIADSDDRFFPEAMEIFKEFWEQIPVKRRLEFTGVTGLCANDDGEIVGNYFPSEVLDSTALETFYRLNIKGEKWGFNRVSVLQEFPFPEIEGVPFYPEGLVWHAIARRYKTRYINKPVRIYSQDAGNQVSHEGISRKSWMCNAYAEFLNNDYDFLHVAPWRFFKTATQCVRFSFHNNDGLCAQFRRIKRRRILGLMLIAVIPGYILYVVDGIQS